MDPKEYEIGGWRFSVEPGAGLVEVDNEVTGQAFAIPADAVADLIVGLLVINPGANPELVASNEMARHFDVIPETILNWFKAGLVPGALLAPYQGPGGTTYNRYLMPKAALDEVKRPTRGNPNFGRQE